MILLILAVFCFPLVFRWYRFAVLNLVYIVAHPFRIKRGRRRLRAFCTIGNLVAFDTWVELKFHYKKDRIDYADWPLVFAMKWDKKDLKMKWNGDCDAVASLAWYWAKEKNLHASYVSIKRPKPLVGHAVCLIKEDGVMWDMVDSTGVVLFMGWDVHYPGCKIIIRKTR